MSVGTSPKARIGRTRFFSWTVAVTRDGLQLPSSLFDATPRCVTGCELGPAVSSRTIVASSMKALRLPCSLLKASCGSSESRPSTGVDPVFLSGRLLRNLVETAGGSTSPVAATLAASDT